jgi:hypothetical protein
LINCEFAGSFYCKFEGCWAIMRCRIPARQGKRAATFVGTVTSSPAGTGVPHVTFLGSHMPRHSVRMIVLLAALIDLPARA